MWFRVVNDRSVLAKILLLTFSALLPLVAGAVFYLLPVVEERLYGLKREKVRELVEVASSMVRDCEQLARRGVLGEEEAKREAARRLRGLRFDDGNYFWISDLKPTLVMHPYQPWLEGKDLANFKDHTGKKVFLEFVDVCRSKGGGFVYYGWPRPGARDETEKLSYVRLFEPWQWVIGSGIYLADTHREIRHFTQWTLLFLGLVVALVVAATLGVARRITAPLEATVGALTGIASGDLSRRVAVSGRDELGRLAAATNRMAEKLEVAREEASAALEAKREFLANVSHEIRTPMNGVLGMLYLTLGSSLDAEQRECLTMAQSSAEALLRLLNDVLDYSQGEAGSLPFENVAFRVRGAVAEAVGTWTQTARERGLDLQWAVDESVPDTVSGDCARLRQVLSHLVSNAVKFTHEGWVTVRVSTASAANEAALQQPLLVTVSDSGIGIPPEKLGLLFESFSQVDGSSTRRYGGLGLGLAVSRRIVEQAGGAIWVASDEGRGTTFSFTFPVHRAANGVTAHPSAAVDLSALRASLGGDQGALAELVACFLADWPPQLERLRRAVLSDDASEVRRLAHTVRGAVGNFKAQGAFLLAGELEKLAAVQPLSLAADVLTQLEDEMAKVRDELAPLRSGWTAKALQTGQETVDSSAHRG